MPSEIAAEPVRGAEAETRRVSMAEAAYWLAGVLILTHALLVALPTPFLNDGFVYIAMVRSLLERGSLAFENGYDAYGADELKLIFFVPVDGELMPQYPSGWAFLAAPFWAIGGIRGLFLLNSLATLLTLWLIRVTARALFGDDRLGLAAALLYAFATYAFDYAGAVWPHAVAIAAMTAGLAAAAIGWRRDAPLWFALAGLAVGLGINLRADAILAAPPIALWILGAAPRPWRGLGAFLLGLLPGLAFAAALNLAKFGVFNPLSYGRGGDDGLTSLDYYVRLLPLVAAVAVAALALGLEPVRRVAYRRPVALGLLAAAVAMTALVPPLREIALRALGGAAGLVVDTQLGFLGGMEHAPDGSLRVHGFLKKALLQSLPYAACILLVLPRLFRGPDRAGVGLLLLTVLGILFPFAFTGWYGGMANHMRYLLHLTPALVILAALALRQIEDAPRAGPALAIALGFGAPLLGLLYGLARGHEIFYVLQITVPDALVAAIAALSLAVLVLRGAARAAAVSGLRGGVWAGVALAAFSAWGLDMVVHQGYRATELKLTEAARPLPQHALFNVFFPTWAFERIGTDTLIASPLGTGRYYDAELIRRAFADGRAVFVQHSWIAGKIVADGVAAAAEQVHDDPDPEWRLYRLTPPRS